MLIDLKMQMQINFQKNNDQNQLKKKQKASIDNKKVKEFELIIQSFPYKKHKARVYEGQFSKIFEGLFYKIFKKKKKTI